MIQRNWTLSNALVNTSAKFCFVSIFLRIISPLSTCSLTKWYLISMCFDLGKSPWFFAKCIHDWLSSRIVNGWVNKHPNSLRSLLNHIASCAVAHAAIYSASIEDNATEVCCFEHQLIMQQPKKNTNAVTDLRVSISLAKLESANAVDSSTSLSVISLVPWLKDTHCSSLRNVSESNCFSRC